MNTIISIPWLTGTFLALMPAGLLVAALPAVRATRHSALGTRYRVRWAAIGALLAALAGDISFFLGAQGGLEIAMLPLPGLSFDLPFSIAVNGLTLVLATLVSFVILMIAQYSVEYLDGDPHQARFFRLLAFTGGFSYWWWFRGTLGYSRSGLLPQALACTSSSSFIANGPKPLWRPTRSLSLAVRLTFFWWRPPC